MEFLPYSLKWLELILRWGHVLFAILWVGNSFLFNFLDNKLNKNIDGISGATLSVWAMKSIAKLSLYLDQYINKVNEKN